MKPFVRSSLLVALLFAGAGCGEEDPFLPQQLDPCTAPVAVTVTAGRIPTISWTPACTVAELLVYQPLAEPTLKWHITSSAGIRPGVRYGIAPNDAGEIVPAAALVAGQEAALELVRFGSQDPRIIGAKSFTP